MVLFRTVWGKGRNEMESYLVRFMVKGYNWSEEMVVPKERAIRMLSDESLLILRMEIQ